MDWFETSHESEKGPAVGATRFGDFRDLGGEFADLAADQTADQVAVLASGTSHQGIVADPHEAFAKPSVDGLSSRLQRFALEQAPCQPCAGSLNVMRPIIAAYECAFGQVSD